MQTKMILMILIFMLPVSCSGYRYRRYIENPVQSALEGDILSGKYIGKNYGYIQSLLNSEYKTIILSKVPELGDYDKKYLFLKDYKEFKENGELGDEHRQRYIEQLNYIFFNNEILTYANIEEYSVYIYPTVINYLPPSATHEEIYLFLVKKDKLIAASKIFPGIPWYSEVPSNANALYFPRQPFPFFMSGEKLSPDNPYADESSKRAREIELGW